MKDYKLSELIQLCKDRMNAELDCLECPAISFCIQIDPEDNCENRPEDWKVDLE